MLDLHRQVWFYTGYGREEMIQKLLSCHPEFPAAGRDLQPARLIAVISLGKVLGPQVNDVTIIG